MLPDAYEDPFMTQPPAACRRPELRSDAAPRAVRGAGGGHDRASPALARRPDPGLAGPGGRVGSATERLPPGHGGARAAAGAGSGGGDRGRQLSRQAARHSVRAEGHLLHRGHSHHRPIPHLRRNGAAGRRRVRCQAVPGRRDIAGQARDARVRAWRPLVRPGVAAGAQPVAHRALHRRLVQRLRRCSGRRAHPGGTRFGHRRLHPAAGGVVRGCRAEADLRPGEPARRVSQLLHLRPCRPDGLDRGRRARSCWQAIAGHDPHDPASADRPAVPTTPRRWA